MSNERPSSEYWPNDDPERLAWNHREIRKEAKDLRVILGQTPYVFPNRERLFEIVDEILSLLPVHNEEDEAQDERDRKILYERLRSVAIDWEQNDD
jgi:hypothetical protein